MTEAARGHRIAISARPVSAAAVGPHGEIVLVDAGGDPIHLELERAGRPVAN